MLWSSISFPVLLTLWTFWMWTVWCCRTVLHYTNRCFWYVADPRWYKLDGQNNINCGCKQVTSTCFFYNNHIFILTFCLSGSTTISRGIQDYDLLEHSVAAVCESSRNIINRICVNLIDFVFQVLDLKIQWPYSNKYDREAQLKLKTK